MNVPSHARAVIIGGGVSGCSVAYHLAKLGWKDVVLLERKQLTSGTTWHAAGLIAQLRATANMTKLAKYSQELYGALEAETRELIDEFCRAQGLEGYATHVLSGNTGQRLLVGIMIGLGYVVSEQLLTQLGSQHQLNPTLVAMAPNLLFLGLALYLLFRRSSAAA